MRRRGAPAAVAAFLLACAGEPPAAPVELTVLTWNLLHGADERGELNLEAKAAYLAAQGADLVFVQEIDERCERSGRVDQMAVLASRTGMDASFGAFMPFQGGRYGLGTLSARPVVASRSLPLPEGGEPRVALLTELAVDRHRLLAVNVHFDWAPDDAARFAQARALLTHLDTLDLPTIVGGDFNDTPESRTLQAFFARGFEPVEPPGPSWPARAPDVDIDHVLVRAGGGARLAPRGGAVLAEDALSDHRPVRAEIRLSADRARPPLAYLSPRSPAAPAASRARCRSRTSSSGPSGIASRVPRALDTVVARKIAL